MKRKNNKRPWTEASSLLIVTELLHNSVNLIRLNLASKVAGFSSDLNKTLVPFFKLTFLLITSILIIVVGSSIYWFISFDLQTINNDSQKTLIYDKNGEVLSILEENNAINYVSIEQLSTHCKEAFISAEDHSFYSNIGVDWKGLIRGGIAEITRTSSGGSTISQQLVKISQGSIQDRSAVTKFKEAVYAIKLDSVLSKNTILEYYVNTVNFGNALYGIGNASQMYFHKTTENLTLPECAYLAGVINKPSTLNPYADFSQGCQRRNTVLDQMYERKVIT